MPAAFYGETVDGGKLIDAGWLAELQGRLEAVVAGFLGKEQN